jgi:hypothetical protein
VESLCLSATWELSEEVAVSSITQEEEQELNRPVL